MYIFLPSRIYSLLGSRSKRHFLSEHGTGMRQIVGGMGRGIWFSSATKSDLKDYGG